MQRLLKFSCHNCGAKLAVPVQMSGLSDNCPKCGTLVTSPTVPPETAPVSQAPVPVQAAPVMPTPSAPAPVPVAAAPPQTAPQPLPQRPEVTPAEAPGHTTNHGPTADTWSAEQLADALRPKAGSPAPVAVGAPRDLDSQPVREKRRAASPLPSNESAVAVVEKPVTPAGGAPAASQETRARRRAQPEVGPITFPQAPELPTMAAVSPAPVAPAAPEQAPRELADLFSSEAVASPFPPAPAMKGLVGEPVVEPTPPQTAAAPTPVVAEQPRPAAVPPQTHVAPPAVPISPPAEAAAPEAQAPEPTSLKALTSRGQNPPQASSRLRSSLQSISRRPLEEDRDQENFLGGVADDEPPAAPPSALMPRTLPDAEDIEKAEQPGMGEMMSSGPGASVSGHAGPMQLPSGDGRPWQHVPLLMVGSSPRRERRVRLNRIAMVGVVAFLMVDLLVVLWFCRKPIANWLSTPSSKNQPVVSHPSSTDGSGTAAATLPASTEASIDLPSPADFPNQTGGIPAAPTPAPETAIEAPVPMAIPVTDYPGESAAAPMPATVSPTEVTPPAPVPPVEAGPAAASAAPALSLVPEEVNAATMAGSVPPVAAPEAPPAPPALVAKTEPPAPPPLPADLPGMAATTPPPADNGVPYGGLPPPPPDMALPNGPIPAPEVTEATVPGPSINLVNSPSVPPKTNRVPKEAQTALVVLQKFLDANSWQERVPLVQKGEALRTAMEKSAGKFGDGPIRVGQIDFVERYVNKNGTPPYCMFELSGGSLEHPVLTLVEQSTKGGVKVDWEAFTDFKESLLLKFLETRGAPADKFRVMLRRKHYFDKDVPDVTSKEAFEVKQPHGTFQGHIFVTKKSALAQQLGNQLGWGMDMPVIAELTWRTDGKHHWVEMTGISSYGWRG